MKTIIEPFKIKVVEAVRITTREEREELLRRAHYNPFMLRSDDILFDFLTDSGTAAMSAAQWSAMMNADEAYAGSLSYYRFEEVVKDLTGLRQVIPVHQGRAAERILFHLMCGEGQRVPNNSHFDTTRANIEHEGAEALDLVIPEGKDPQCDHPFKGNIDLNRLEALLKEFGHDRVPLGMLTVTNNTGGGQPVSLENIRQTKELLHKYDIPLFLDACRFAENAYFIKMREPGYADKTPKEIAREMFSHCDGCTMSCKKDGLCNIGGFLAMNSDGLADRARANLILTEGFPTYGGLAGRDLEAMAVGLQEVVDERYLEYRIASTRYLTRKLNDAGVQTVQPPGGHAAYVDARAFLPDVPVEQYPGQALACELYLEIGIRAVEIGSVMFGKRTASGESYADMDLVRLAVPRRVYTQSHVDYIGEAIVGLMQKRDRIPGYRFTYQAPVLRHFTARFEPVG
jgi:tyrosine phenol-lyase